MSINNKGQVSANLESATREREFVALARYKMVGRGNRGEALSFARERRASGRILEILEKNVVEPGSLDPGNWAGGGFADSEATLASAFLNGSSVRYGSSFDTINAAGAFRPGVMQTHMLSVTVGINGAEHFEGNTKVISRLTLADATLSPRRAAAIVAISDALSRLGGSRVIDFLYRELGAAVGITADAMFLRGLVDYPGVAILEASGGETVADFVDDLTGGLQAVDGGARSRWFAVITPSAAKTWAALSAGALPTGSVMTPNGGVVAGVQIVVSNSLPSGVQMIVLDADQIVADPGTVILDGSRTADIRLDDESSDGAGELISLFQANMAALKAERLFAFEPLRATAIAIISDTLSS